MSNIKPKAGPNTNIEEQKFSSRKPKVEKMKLQNLSQTQLEPNPEMEQVERIGKTLRNTYHRIAKGPVGQMTSYKIST